MGLEIAYIGLSLFMTIVLLYINIKASNKGLNKSPVKFLFLLVGWHFYIYALSLTGFIENFDFPPRFFLLTILPAFIFIGWFVNKTKNSSWLSSIPPHWLVFYQSFRIIIETIFIFTVMAGLLHSNVTIEGYNFDMVYAFTSIIIGYLIIKGYYKIGVIWNILGLVVIAIIIFLFQTTIYLPEMYGPDTARFPIEFMKYPYILVPAFLMPSAVFIHALSIAQLKKLLTQNKRN